MSDIVERLERQNDRLLMTGHDFSDVLLDAAAEIKRLNNVLQLALDEKAQVIVEVERLREVNALNVANWQMQCDDLRAEIERLRQLLRAAGVPEWVINPDENT